MASSFGLDISDESVKFIELIHSKGGIKTGRYGERIIPPGVIESGKIKDSKKMEEILSTLRKEEGVRSVRVSLPEEQVYLFELRLERRRTQLGGSSCHHSKKYYRKLFIDF